MSAFVRAPCGALARKTDAFAAATALIDSEATMIPGSLAQALKLPIRTLILNSVLVTVAVAVAVAVTICAGRTGHRA